MNAIEQCPFYKGKAKKKIRCEGGELKFYDGEAYEDYRIRFCANNIDWTKCSVAKSLLCYYERKEK